MNRLFFLTVVLAAGSLQPLAAEDLSARVRQLTEQAMPWVIEIRRDIHAHPELSNREERTAAKVAEELKKIGLEDFKTGVAHHGVVALIRGKQPGPTVALRADMDALPVVEDTGLSFTSQNPGVMHACGHDTHTAMLLGASRVLYELRDQLAGNVKLIFQPAEEGAPAGETGGARQMVEEGVLEHPKVAAIFGLHVNPAQATGTIGYREGPILAAVDRFQITITGKQSHGAMPWQGEDPIVAAAHVITALQTISSRHIDARQPVVVSVGSIHAGTRYNIIPGEAVMEGTIRTYDGAVRRKVLELARQIVEHTALAHGTQGKFSDEDLGPATWNDPELTRRMKPTLVKIVGAANAQEVEPLMAAEDFAFYGQKIPALFVFLGVWDQRLPQHSLHTPQVLIDERALPVGVRLLAMLAVDYLQGEDGRRSTAPN
jgi:amidohydrolase